MFKPTITKEELKQLPKKSFKGRIFVVDSFPSFNKYIPIIKLGKLWGFDTETRPAFKKGIVNKPAVVQLANEAYAFLFRMGRIGLPDELRVILEDPSIIKVGVAVHDDLKDLKMYHDIKPEGFIDLQKYAGTFGIEAKGLNKLSAIVLKFRISKSQQTSNWENRELTAAQRSYAATDAWICYKIYRKLKTAESK